MRRSPGKALAAAGLAMALLLAASPGLAQKPPPMAGQVQLAPLPQMEGMVDWSLLAQVDIQARKDRYVPKFSPQVQALDGKEIRLAGYMLPLENKGKQKRFLLSRATPHCAFCMPGGPEAIAVVEARAGIAFTMDPIVVTGRLVLQSNDPGSMFYKLVDAVQVRP